MSNGSDFDKIKNLVESKELKNKKVIVYCHPNPDPDAVGSMLGMQFLFETFFGLETEICYTGEISHPQNKAMVQLLDTHMRKIECDHNDDCFLRVLVDTIPLNAGAPDNTKFDLVVDHHKELPNGSFNGLLIHHHTGSCCGIVYEIIRDSGVNLSDEDERWVRAANGLMVGIITDTDHCMSVDTTRRDFMACQELFPYQDHDLIRKIIKFNRPMSWIKWKGLAINDAVIDEAIAVAGLGILPAEHRDVIADVAGDMLTWGNVQTAVVFALFGDRIEGSVRTNNEAAEIHTLCHALGGKHGSGGGKLCKGAYKKPLGSMSIDDDDDEIVQQKMWEVIKQREIAKIFKVMKK